MKYNLIVAMCEGNGIGYRGLLPWQLKDDLRHFSKLTKGSGSKNAVIMGSRTWQSLPRGSMGLAGRDNFILSASGSCSFDLLMDDEAHLIKTFRSVLELETYIESLPFTYEDIWIIGGSAVYEEFLAAGKINKCHVTYIDKMFECDTFFPGLPNMLQWQEISRETTYNAKYKCNVDYVVYENLNCQ